MSALLYNPSQDGVSHLNVYSRGATDLGRFLSNFAFAEIKTPDGGFLSVEGYWYWLQTDHPHKDSLRTRWGWEAKQEGRQMRLECPAAETVANFQERICAAITDKMKRAPYWAKQLAQNKLPLAHYYVYGGKVIASEGSEWILAHLDALADKLRKGEPL